ncbi:MAG: O-methyltransferase [Bacteroidota bacterium]|mgnify:CR=1 FL=1
MNAWIKAIHEYCTAHSTPPPDSLYQLERETHLKTLAPQMLSGPLQGRFLAMLSRLMQPQSILEVGTFTGYGAHCLAEGLVDTGTLHTIEGNPETVFLIRKHLQAAGLQDKVQLHQGDAKAIIPTIEGQFDLVFLDANKREYDQYLDLVADRIRPGGLLLADNVLWSGKVVSGERDQDTQMLDAFNKRVLSDERFVNLILPLRDGLLMAQRR